MLYSLWIYKVVDKITQYIIQNKNHWLINNEYSILTHNIVHFHFLIILYSGPNGNFVIFSAPVSVTIKISCSRYPPAPSIPSGMATIGSMDTIIPGCKMVWQCSWNSISVQSIFCNVIWWIIFICHVIIIYRL